MSTPATNEADNSPSLSTRINLLPQELIDLILHHTLSQPPNLSVPITSTWRPPPAHQLNRSLRAKYREEYFLSTTFVFRAEFGRLGAADGHYEKWAKVFEAKGRIVDGWDFSLVFWGGSVYGRRLVKQCEEKKC
jgi:hypothetical protein